MTWEQVIVLGLASLGGAGLVIWFMKREFASQAVVIEKIDRRMDCFEQNQHACQLENAKTYVTKSEFCDIEKSVIDHDRRLIKIESGGSRQ